MKIRSGMIRWCGVWVGIHLIAGAMAYGQAGGGGGSGGGGGGGGSGGRNGTGGGGRIMGGGSPMGPLSGRRATTHWGGAGSLLNLLADEGVRKELGLSAEQAAQAESAVRRVKGLEEERIGAAARRVEARGEIFRQRAERMEAMKRDAVAFEAEILGLLDARQKAILGEAREKDRVASAGIGPRVAVSASGGPGVGAGPSAVGQPSGSASGTSISVPAGVGTVRTNASSSGGSYAGGGEPGSVIRVIREASVAESMKLSANQRVAILGVLDRFDAREMELWDEMKKSFENPRPRGATAEAAAHPARAAAEATRTLEAMLTPAQRTRVEELSMQAEGPGSLFRPKVMDALKLTATQQARLASVAQQTQRETDAIIAPEMAAGPAGLMGVAGPPKAPMMADINRVTAIRRRGAEQLLSVLTPAQRQAYQKLRGRPYPGIERIPGFGGGGTVEYEETSGPGVSR